MRIRLTEKLINFGEPDFVNYHANKLSANCLPKGMRSRTSIEIDSYRNDHPRYGNASEMKKVFSLTVCALSPHTRKPRAIGQHLLHLAANVDIKKGYILLVQLFRNGGKTTLSADARRL